MRRSILFFIPLWLVLDQWLKAYTVASVPPFPDMVDILPGFLSLAYITNEGAAWGMFQGQTLILSILRATVGLALAGYLLRRPSIPFAQVVALTLIAAGALGNAIDGFMRGEVVDMLLSHTLSALYTPVFGGIFPIFNLADVAVVCGAILLILSTLFIPGERPQTETN